MTKKQNEIITLNVCGIRFNTLRKTINKIRKGRIWKTINTFDENELEELCDDFSPDLTEFFFDRDPSLFKFILNYYRIGKLHICSNLCPVNLNNELIYWDLENPFMDICCEEKLYDKQNEVEKARNEYHKIIKMVKEQRVREIQNESNKLKLLKVKISNAVDKSFDINSTVYAKVYFSGKIFLT